jgi:uncharacterized protein YigE (DUF2233 family)
VRFSVAIALLAVLGACSQRTNDPKKLRCDAVQGATVLHEGATFDVVCAPTRKANIRVHSGSPSQTIGELRSQLERAGGKPFAITNAGIFEPDFRPTGLLISGGRESSKLNPGKGSGNFFMQPNGVFFLDLGAGILETSEYARLAPNPVRHATQSGPLLVQAGKLHPELSKASEHKALRSGVGVSAGRVFFAVSRDEVTFWSLATLFRDGLDCPDALYLDGAISELWAPSLGRTETSKSFSGLISVEAK